MRAFSMLELLVTVAIAGILATLSVGIGSDVVRDRRAQEQVEEVRALLVTARNHARRNGACVRVALDTTGRGLVAAPFTDPGAGCPATQAPASPIPKATVRLLRLSAFQTLVGPQIQNRPDVTFGTDGSLRQASPTSLTLSGVGRPRTLFIWPAAGVVKVMRSSDPLPPPPAP